MYILDANDLKLLVSVVSNDLAYFKYRLVEIVLAVLFPSALAVEYGLAVLLPSALAV